MVLVNTLTVEAINTALIALQRGQSIVVGGEKPSTTVNNITISNGGGGSGGSGLDFTPQINALDKRVGLLEKAEELLRLENERQNERLEALEGLGITDFYFDDTSRELTIELANGEVFDTEVTSESFSMEVVNGELIIRIGEQVHTVTLPMGSQADWTQTDPDDPSFIKHKIPIWITQGSADDNMSPIDSVTDGSMRPVTSNAVADAISGLDVASVGGSGKYIQSISEVDGKIVAVEQNIANTVTVDNLQSVSSNAVAQALSYSETEHQVGYWTDGNPLYEKTVYLRVPANGGYTFSVESGAKVKDWRGNFYQGSVDNPSWIMHIPYTFIDTSTNTFLNIYVFYNGGDEKFYCTFEGTYAPSYYNGYARITYKYTKT